jgi:hypothetical protein
MLNEIFYEHSQRRNQTGLNSTCYSILPVGTVKRRIPIGIQGSLLNSKSLARSISSCFSQSYVKITNTLITFFRQLQQL